MFGLFRKKPAPDTSNGWIALSVGEDIPAKIGQKFDIRTVVYGDVYGLVFGTPSSGKTSTGRVYVYTATGYAWAPIVTHYRLHKPTEISASDETRARRENEWHDWARTAESLIDGDGYLPLKRHERVRR